MTTGVATVPIAGPLLPIVHIGNSPPTTRIPVQTSASGLSWLRDRAHARRAAPPARAQPAGADAAVAPRGKADPERGAAARPVPRRARGHLRARALTGWRRAVPARHRHRVGPIDRGGHVAL